MHTAKVCATSSASSPLGPLAIDRRAPTATDVRIEIFFCGVCHSVRQRVRNEWRPAGHGIICGSINSGLPETRETPDFCGEHDVTADIEIFAIGPINDAYERLLNADAKYHFVIDMTSLHS